MQDRVRDRRLLVLFNSANNKLSHKSFIESFISAESQFQSILTRPIIFIYSLFVPKEIINISSV